MRMKAKAYQQYGDEAVMALVLESLPSIAKQVAKPLEKVKNSSKNPSKIRQKNPSKFRQKNRQKNRR